MSAVRQGATSAQAFGRWRVLFGCAPQRVSAGIHEFGLEPTAAGCSAHGSATSRRGIAEGNDPRCPTVGPGSCVGAASASPIGIQRGCGATDHARPDRFSSARACANHEHPAPFFSRDFRISRGNPTQADPARGTAPAVQSRAAQARCQACHGRYVDAQTTCGKDPLAKDQRAVGSSSCRHSARTTTQAGHSSLHRPSDG